MLMLIHKVSTPLPGIQETETADLRL